jgi:hypothetical protein
MQINQIGQRFCSLAFALALTSGLCAFPAYAQETPAAKPATLAKTGKVENVQIPKGAVILVVLDTEISSKTTKVGDQIEAHLSTMDEADIFPRKTQFFGKIGDIKPKTASGPGAVVVKFTQAVLPDGSKLEIEASPRPLAKENAESASKDSRNKQRGGGIGGKAAVGALLGTAVAGNDTTGAIIGGTVAAAAAGSKKNKAAAAEAAKTVDIVIKEATKFELVFTKSFILKKTVAP